MTARIKVSGKVQGVYFRVTTRDQARSLGLSGYVMNESDGSVSIVATGNKESILDLADWCKTGVELARVDHVKHEWVDNQTFSNFDIKK